jgi:hypothetical protein
MIGLGVYLPDQFSAPFGGVDLVDRSPAVGDVQEAVFGDRRALEPTMRPDAATLQAAELQRPNDLEVLDGLAIDLVQRRKAMGGIVLVRQQPVALFLVSIDQTI